MNFRCRRRSVAAAVEARGGDACLVSHGADLRYLSGFTGSAGALAFAGGRWALFTDGRYRTQAKQEVGGTRVSIVEGSPSAAACRWMETSGAERCCFDPEHTSVAQAEMLRKALPARRRRGWLLPASGMLSRIREIKDSDEIEVLARAAALGDRLFAVSLRHAERGSSEVDLALVLETAARRAGAEGMSFETIVASGERSALPHGRATLAKLPRRGFVTLDFGVVLDGYCSDMTRTLHLGRAQSEERDVYHSVLEAQMSAIEAVGPGAVAGEIDEAARSVLRRAGLARYFTHSTGHGVGIEIHEGPRLAANGKQPIEAGMVITVEPGVYLPGRFGVRIEDMVLVTETGHTVLTRAPKAMVEL